MDKCMNMNLLMVLPGKLHLSELVHSTMGSCFASVFVGHMFHANGHGSSAPQVLDRPRVVLEIHKISKAA